MYLSVHFERIEAIFSGITITSFSHPPGFIVCSVHPNGHFCSDWQEMLCAQPDTLSPLLLSSWCPEQKPQPEKVLRECIPLPGSPLLLEKHSPAQWFGTKDLVRGWAPQASLRGWSVPRAYRPPSMVFTGSVPVAPAQAHLVG